MKSHCLLLARRRCAALHGVRRKVAADEASLSCPKSRSKSSEKTAQAPNHVTLNSVLAFLFHPNRLLHILDPEHLAKKHESDGGHPGKAAIHVEKDWYAMWLPSLLLNREGSTIGHAWFEQVKRLHKTSSISWSTPAAAPLVLPLTGPPPK